MTAPKNTGVAKIGVGSDSEGGVLGEGQRVPPPPGMESGELQCSPSRARDQAPAASPQTHLGMKKPAHVTGVA